MQKKTDFWWTGSWWTFCRQKLRHWNGRTVMHYFI